MDKMENIKKQLEENGYDYAVAIATEAEIKNGAACGQLAIIVENEEWFKKPNQLRMYFNWLGFTYGLGV